MALMDVQTDEEIEKQLANIEVQVKANEEPFPQVPKVVIQNNLAG